MHCLNIAIVEDESSHAELMKLYIGEWAREHHIGCHFHKFPDAESFLFEWEENRVWDALFLDIQMPGIDGVELARRIRTQDEKVVIVFTTGITDYLQEGYEVAAMHYLVKPLDREKVGKCMERIVKERTAAKTEHAFLMEVDEIKAGVAVGHSKVRFVSEEILYIEAFAHYTEVHLEEGVYRVHEGIGAWKNRMEDEFFVCCHRSYLVNLLYVARIDKAEVVLDNEARLPLSRRNQRAVNAAFIRFYSRK